MSEHFDNRLSSLVHVTPSAWVRISVASRLSYFINRLKILHARVVSIICCCSKKNHGFFYFHVLFQVGWKYQDIIEALEAKRKVKGEAFYKGQKEVNKAKTEILKDPKIVKKIAPLQATIEALGHK